LTGPHSESPYDTVLIGSGPINLLEALVLSRAGKKCLVVETRNQLGGAWGAVSYPGLPPIEAACHRSVTDS
jgi:phytoene dehydrogenase-like protein